MIPVAAGVAVFTAVMLLLVGALLVAKRKLVQHGEVTIHINDDPAKAVRTHAGGTLLATLAENNVFLPAGCGGKGSCGTCEVVVREGGGAVLPTESGFISPGEAKRGHRLACQVRVQQDLRIELPTTLLGVRKVPCKVVGNANVSTFIKELRLALPDGEEMPFRAGGYVQIECPPHALSFSEFHIDPEFREEWDKFDLWRFRSVVGEPTTRAYSMANYPLEKGILLFTIRIAFPPGYRVDVPPGKMSSWLFNLKPGDEVMVSGPYGEFYARDSENEMCFVAAGAGMAPMRSHILDQLKRLHTGRKMTFWYSARNLKEAFYVKEFDQLQAEHPNFRWHLVLSEPHPEDNWTGLVGLVRNNVLRDTYLKSHPAPEDIEYYLCGPGVMNKAVINMLLSLGVDRENIMLDDFG